MDSMGLVFRYPANRPLTETDIELHLEQNRRLNVKPRYQLSVISMNSTYMESVDKWFAWKGFTTLFAMTCIIMFTVAFFSIVGLLTLKALRIVPSTEDVDSLINVGAVLIASWGIIIWMPIWLLKKESFAYTHYPIRFNRSTRMVHVFRTNGTVLSTAWDDIYFALGYTKGLWEVRGYVMAENRITVLETFVLSCLGVISDHDLTSSTTNFSDDDYVRGHWEFIRRYMEDGPESVAGQVEFCMPIDRCKERAINGFHRIMANFSGGSFVLIAIMFPFCALIALFRALAMKTSKIPQWPEEIEAVNLVKLGDPYAIRGDSDGNRVAVFPQAAHDAGVAFSAAAN